MGVKGRAQGGPAALAASAVAAEAETLVAPGGGARPARPDKPAAAEADTLAAPAPAPAPRGPGPRHAMDAETLAGPANGAAPGSVPELALLADDQRYLIGGEVARGGLGRILEATDTRLRRQVALKELLSPGGDAEVRFLREALITARLQHPSIIPLHDAGRWHNGQLFYSMKLVTGSSFEAAIEAKATLAERLALLPHVIDVAEAIAYAHSRRIIHRDLKPQNVLVGSFGETVVIDWGIAKDLSLASADSERGGHTADLGDAAADLTLVGAVMGTPAYMPPEQARGASVDERADVYALGAILYHLLAGMPPYGDASTREVLLKLRASPPQPPAPLRSLLQGVPRELEAIVEKALSPELERRYRSAEALVVDLKKFQTGQIVGAYRYSARELVTRWLRRHRAAASLLTLLALAAVLSFAQLVDRGRIAEEGRKLAEAERSRAEAARESAARAEERERRRADEVTLAQARISVDRDPEESLRLLTQLSPSYPHFGAARTIAADALSRALPRSLRGHAGGIITSVISPDGKRIASGSYDRTVRLWDVASGRSTVLAGHTGAIPRLAFSPDSKRLVSASYDKTLRLWELDSGRSVVLAGHGDWLAAVAFSPDGQHIASGGADKTVRLWDVAGPAAPTSRVLSCAEGIVAALAFSADGAQLAAVRRNGNLCLWDVDSGTERLSRPGPIEDASSVRFSPDRARVAVGSSAGDVLLWEMASGRAHLLQEHGSKILDLAFSSDGKSLAAAARDDTVRLWDVRSDAASAKPPRLLPGHGGAVAALAFSPDDKHLAAAGADAAVRIWSLASGDVEVLRAHQSAVTSLAFTPDGKQLVSAASDTTLRQWTLSREVGVVRLSKGGLDDATLTPDGKRLFVVDSDDQQVHLWDVAPWQSEVLPGRAEPFARLALTPDGRVLIFCGDDGALRRWDVAPRPARALPTPRGRCSQVRGYAFSRDGRFVVGAGLDGVQLWDLSGQDPDAGRVLSRHSGGAFRVALSPDGKHLASAGADRLVRLHDTATWKGRDLPGHESLVMGLEFSPDSQLLASASLDGTVRLWDVASGDSRTFAGSEGGIYRARFSPKGDLLATSSDAGPLRLWDLASGDSRVLRGHEDHVQGLDFSPDGLTLASSGADGSLRLWDVETGESRVLRGHTSEATRLQFSADGSFVVSAAQGGTVGVWRDDLPHTRDALLAHIAALLGPAPTTPTP